jgi:hypothetical protein
MYDLQVLAWQADITRVSTFQVAKELSGVVYPKSTIRDAFHTLSHHSNIEENIKRFTVLNTYHTMLFANFIERLKNTPDGDGSLLDNTVILYGSGMGNSSLHDHENLPILVAGGKAYGMKGGRHIKYEKPAPLANLHLTLLDRVGIRLDSFGDSDGKIEGLFEAL